MARPKVTITLDRSKADQARVLAGARSTSEVINLALDRLIRTERLMGDVAGYGRVPPTEAEVHLGLMASDHLGDDTDWEGLYAGGAR
ncbi:MAG TPA: type II toxin-antitoxin system VapB family antitoxin [Verrucomicrobiae bacterium]|nr:type II toxin-antitoxin system VapB family antitoxin [Verrucomicrobiae bacterium]